MRRIATLAAKPFVALGRVVAGFGRLLQKAWNSERVMILTAAGIIAQTIVDGTNEGLTADTIWKNVVYAIGGLIARQGVWSQNSIDKFGETDDL